MIVPLIGFELVLLAYHLVEVPTDTREHFSVAVSHSKEPVDCSVLRCHDVCSLCVVDGVTITQNLPMSTTNLMLYITLHWIALNDLQAIIFSALPYPLENVIHTTSVCYPQTQLLYKTKPVDKCIPKTVCYAQAFNNLWITLDSL
jgi:hypothetical protein